MVKLGPYEVHPFADAFPLIDGEEFAELVADVKKNGLRDPIILNHDKTVLIDGRNRYRACSEAGVDLLHEVLGSHYTEPMILDLILSKNLARRQLNQGQKALMALEYERFYAEAVKAEEAARKEATGGPVAAAVRNGTNGNVTTADLQPRYERQSATRAAKAVGASGRSVAQAKAVQRDAPDLAEQVRAGQIALDAADRQRRQRLAAMPKPEPAPAAAGPIMLTLRTHDGREVPYAKPASKATFNETKGEGISWAAWSWNPVTGCLHGCDYCYAREIATNERFRPGFPAGFTPLFHHERLDAPANTAIPAAHRNDEAYRRVFVCSMADLYGRWVPDEWIQQIHESMCKNPEWQYITLTKFPARYIGLDMPPGAWVGTSVDEQKRVRIAENAFRQIGDVAVKWLSLEPLREPLQFEDLSMFDWVVIGAQTETRQPGGTVPAFAPPFEWVARIVAQAREAGCKVHLKPNLLGRTHAGNPGMQLPDEYPTPHAVTTTGGH
jgi:protein gp37/ParB-like chromosome segregation protein Spo0J